MKRTVRESVRGLVEFILKTGSIDNRFSISKRAIEGIKAHQKLQKSNKTLYKRYDKEVYLSEEFNFENFTLKLDGRADGIIYDNEDIIIEEIKSTYKPFLEINDRNELHWAQAKVYGYMYLLKNNLMSIYIQLSYYQLESDEVKSFKRQYTFSELENFFNDLINKYEKYIKLQSNHKYSRNKSIKELNFPFVKYRDGQLKMAKAVYGTIKEGKELFVQAPTGIGKTISTIFPAIKAIGEGHIEKIFYLTAKTVNKKVAEDTFNILRNKGLNFRSITITAKQKICLNDKISCNPDECKYAIDYYDKSRNAIYELLKEERNINRDLILEISNKYGICPFELSLELINWCDGIICDYNYIFDKRVGLKGVIDDIGNEISVLVDEGHNLVDRARSMYSASLNKEKFLKLRRNLKNKSKKLYKTVNKVNSYFIDLRKECESIEKNSYHQKEAPKDLYKILRSFMNQSEDELIKLKDEPYYDELLEVYFDINSFLSISEEYDKNYVTYIEKNGQNISINLFCVNPSEKIKSIIKKLNGTIIFSATLSPIEYYIDLLGGSDESYRLRLKSPFDSKKFNVRRCSINTRFKFRESTIQHIKKEISYFLSNNKGNSMIFFPSYEYLELFMRNSKYDFNGYNLLIQKREMDEIDKENFISEFRNKQNIVGLFVLGGVFSEGIDLPGDMLIGVIIVGVGYPKISMEREIIKEYFNEKGYDYSYIYPGINKVFQAVGRVIRTEDDEGSALLIDDRYFNKKYDRLLPSDWNL